MLAYYFLQLLVHDCGFVLEFTGNAQQEAINRGKVGSHEMGGRVVGSALDRYQYRYRRGACIMYMYISR